ncbi:MAG: hypothetical protein K6C41_04700 [Lachnospiraceae bacterium]|nr:hypothetical protein [Lachnospiraceae bacterium]
MNTKKLFSKLIKEKLWLFLLILTVGFFFFPVRVIFLRQTILAGTEQWMTPDFGLVTSALGISASGLDKFFMMLLVVIAAFIAAGVSFHYLHDVSRTDFWMSLPIKRKKRFLLHMLSGALSAIIPFAIVFLSAGIISIATGMLTGYGITQFFLTMLSLILIFFAVYLLSCLCHVLTGRTAIGVLLTGLFLVIGPGLIYLFEGMCGCFFTHYISEIDPSVVIWLSPALLPLSGDQISSIIIALIYSLVFLVLSLIAAEKRPAEAAGTAFSSRFLPSFVKITVTIMGSLFFGLFLSSFGSKDLKGWFLFFMVIAAVLLPMVMDLIFSMDLRAIKKNWKINLLAFGLPLLISIFFAADITGYDRFIPDKDAVASVGVIGDDPANYQGYIYVRGGVPEETYFSDAPASIEESIRFVQNNDGYEESYGIVRLDFHLRDGRSVKRQYFAPRDEVSAIYDTFSKDEKYREDLSIARKLSNLDEKTSFLLTEIKPDGGEDAGYSISLSESERKALIDALIKDESKMTYSDYESSSPIYSISIRRSFENKGAEGDVFIYPEFEETMKIIEKLD